MLYIYDKPNVTILPIRYESIHWIRMVYIKFDDGSFEPCINIIYKSPANDILHTVLCRFRGMQNLTPEEKTEKVENEAKEMIRSMQTRNYWETNCWFSVKGDGGGWDNLILPSEYKNEIRKRREVERQRIQAEQELERQNDLNKEPSIEEFKNMYDGDNE